MSKPEFVYVTYIAATPEKVWEALTRGDFSERYWYGRRVESDWKVGSSVNFLYDSGRELSDSGIILESDPPKRLSYSFRVEFEAELRAEGYSRVTFQIEPMDSIVKLTVTHDEFSAGSKVLVGVSNGWPAILSSLKSLLETGKALAFPGE